MVSRSLAQRIPMVRKRKFSQEETLPFEIPPSKRIDPATGFKSGNTPPPVWTENKARLIERYLRFFLFITRHGTYIDGFAGPQAPGNPDSWAARLAVEIEPKWLRHFHLFDNDKPQARRLERLKVEQTDRDVNVYSEDFNLAVGNLLKSGIIAKKEAVFCLIDQRTFECGWATLEAIAGYQAPRPHKIELFYFLPNSWFERALAGMKEDTKRATLPRWWGKNDWRTFVAKGRSARCEAFCDRLRSDLGYTFVNPYAIRQREDQGNIMYYMLHASDHPEAPKLMQRAYRNAVLPPESQAQLSFEFEGSGR